jgi:hypothetical protein
MYVRKAGEICCYIETRLHMGRIKPSFRQLYEEIIPELGTELLAIQAISSQGNAVSDHSNLNIDLIKIFTFIYVK